MNLCVHQTYATQRGEANEQHQNVTELVVQRDPITLSTIHQVTPQTITQTWAVNVHHDDNHELVQSFDEVVSIKQPWQSTTPNYYLPISGAPTQIIICASFQNQPSTTNVNLVPTNLKVQNNSQLLNKLE
jgi:hypothetical protein